MILFFHLTYEPHTRVGLIILPSFRSSRLLTYLCPTWFLASTSVNSSGTVQRIITMRSVQQGSLLCFGAPEARKR